MKSCSGWSSTTLPLDVLTTAAPETHIAISHYAPASLPPTSITAVVRAIQNNDKRGGAGLIFAGSGARWSSGPEGVRRLAERLDWPVMTTPKGKGVFPETHPLSLGVFGAGGHPSAERYLEQGIDTMIVLGTSLGDLATGGWNDALRPRETLIQVDIDMGQVGRNYGANIAVAAPVSLFTHELCRRLLPRTLSRSPKPWLRSCGVLRQEHASKWANGPEGRIAPQRAIWEIQRRMAKDTIFAIDSGEHFFFATHYLEIERPDAFIAMIGLGSMASSISAIGAKLAMPHRSVAVICGDGGFAMLAPEIATAAQNGLEIAFFVFNDQRLGMVEHGQRRIYDRTPSYDTTPLDVTHMAAAVGARSVAVTRAGDLLALDLPKLLDQSPLVIDVHIDRQVVMPKNRRIAALSAQSGTAKRRA